MKDIKQKLTSPNFLYSVLFTVFMSFFMTFPIYAQEETNEATEEVKKDKPARQAFESAWWFDGQTGLLYDKKTLEWVIQHRFGNINNGLTDVFGLYGPTNVRLGMSYGLINNLNIGLGYTKNKQIFDINAKYGIFTQTRSNSMPISLAYYGIIGMELLDEENYVNSSHRYSFFHSLIITRRFSSKISAQLGPSVSHYNAVYVQEQEDSSLKKMNNDTWGISAGVRYKITSQMIFMLGYDHPITEHEINQPESSFNIGLEVSTSSHAFQVFFTNNQRILPQENFTFNTNQYRYSEYLIGFNITRLWSF